jgi:hypothetical protein
VEHLKGTLVSTALAANTRLGWKSLTRTNTLAYGRNQFYDTGPRSQILFPTKFHFFPNFQTKMKNSGLTSIKHLLLLKPDEEAGVTLRHFCTVLVTMLKNFLRL